MMCEEQQHKLHPSHHLHFPSKSLRDIDIPPRKLFGRSHRHVTDDDGSTLLRRFLPRNEDEEDDDPYASEQFRMYEFKVRRCTRSRSHDWTDCPFAHPGEKARRRDPRRYQYSGTVCPEFRRGACSKGDNCEFAHGVFECWLHPARYRTEACKDGKNCKRKVCFFAHTPRQLRLLPSSIDSPSSPPPDDRKYLSSITNHCCSCVYCHHSNISASSPTSTLLNMSHFSPPLSPSPSLSPPLSPATAYSPVSRFSKFGGLSYKEALTELMSSIEGLSVNEAQNRMMGCYNINRSNLSWVDVNNGLGNGDEQSQQQQQSQFVLSPRVVEESRESESGLSCPDLGWVNDLLT